MQGILEQRATPAGAAGKDSIWGWGRLALGAANAPTAPTGNLFTGLSPSARLLDTRTANNPLGGGSTRTIQLAGTNGVPADATAVVLSVVAIKPTAAGYLTAFPAGAARPVASSLNFAQGQVISNSVTVGLGPSGAIGLFNYAHDPTRAPDRRVCHDAATVIAPPVAVLRPTPRFTFACRPVRPFVDC